MKRIHFKPRKTTECLAPAPVCITYYTCIVATILATVTFKLYRQTMKSQSRGSHTNTLTHTEKSQSRIYIYKFFRTFISQHNKLLFLFHKALLVGRQCVPALVLVDEHRTKVKEIGRFVCACDFCVCECKSVMGTNQREKLNTFSFHSLVFIVACIHSIGIVSKQLAPS